MSVSILTSFRNHLLESLPGDILELICDNTDPAVPEEEAMEQEVSDALFSSFHVPLPEQEASRAARGVPQECTVRTTTTLSVPLLKHRTNQAILAMSQVCRSWRRRLICLKRLWRVIAFDANSEPASVQLAMLFLTRIKDDDILVHVYAGFPLNNLVDPAITALLLNLRERTVWWERFIYWGRLGKYRRFLDLPAPKLREFSDNRDLSHLYYGCGRPLFAGHTPMLRSLVTSTLGEWTSEAFSNLRTLHLRVCDTNLPIKSLLNVLRRASQLVELKFASPTIPPHDCTACEPVNLPHMKSVRVFNPGFHMILTHLVVPNVRSMEVSSVHPGVASSLQIGPAFQAPHPFIEFPPVPVLNLPISFIHCSVQCSPSRFSLTIDLRTQDDASFVIKLSWIGGQKIHHWKRYFERSISALTGMETTHSPVVSLIAEFPFDYTPLLHLPGIKVVAFAGDLQKLLQVLADCDGGNEAPLLPRLRCLFAHEDDLNEATIWSVASCLQFRPDLIIIVSAANRTRLVEVLGSGYVIEGKFDSLVTHTRL